MASADITVTLEGDNTVFALRIVAAELRVSAAQARAQMLSQTQDEQRAFWTGAYDAYMRAALAVEGSAASIEKEKIDAANPG